MVLANTEDIRKLHLVSETWEGRHVFVAYSEMRKNITFSDEYLDFDVLG